MSRVINIDPVSNYPIELLRLRPVSRPETETREKAHAHARSNRIFRAPLALSVLVLETRGSVALFFRLKGVGNRKTSSGKKSTLSSTYLLKEFDYASLVGWKKACC